jgi:flagellin
MFTLKIKEEFIMIINHNLAANNAIRNANVNQSAASKSMQKLSSGLRINSASDDAAGLAISEKMKGQIRGLDQASSNAQDGISMIQTAEGALSETQSILQRMRELAVQSSTDTNTADDRSKIQSETDQLAKEITRISTDTEFNTQKLINGGISDTGIKSATFHVGANAGQGITLSIGAMDAKSLGVTRDVSTSSLDTDKNNAKITTVSSDSVDVTKSLSDGKYNVKLTAEDAGATSATDATGNAVANLVSGTATADTNITLTYTDHGTAATNLAGTALASSSTGMSVATTLKVNGTTVNLTKVAALGTVANPQTSESDIVTALQTDVDTALGSDKYKVSVDANHKLTIASVATGSTTKVDLSGSDTASASLLGFSSTATASGAATGGTKDWVASGSLGGVVSSKNNTVNGVTIDQTKLSTTAALGDKITVKGFKDATLSAQLSSIGTGVAAVTNSTTAGATVAATAVTGTASANTDVTLTYSTASAATATGTTVASTLTADATIKFKIDGGAEISVTISTGKTLAQAVAQINSAAGTTVATVNAATTAITLTSGTRGTTSSVQFTGTDASLGVASAAATTGSSTGATIWVASGDLTGTFADANTVGATVNGLTVDFTKITGTAVDGETVKIKANASSDIGKAVTVDQKNGGTYVLGDSTGAGQLEMEIGTNTSKAGTSTLDITTNVATSAAKQADGTMSTATATAGIDVSTQSKASAAITTIETAIQKVSAERSKLGAYQNRLEHTIANLGTSSENLTSAQSRIADVDMAKEMSTFSKNNILSQAAQAMLAQANQQPQQVLQLLK